MTGEMGISDNDCGHGRTRRRVLRTAAGTAVGSVGVLALAGCGLFGDDAEPPSAPDPAQPVLDGALALAGAYDRAIAAQPALAGTLAPIVEAHRAHAAELTRMIGGRVRTSAAAPGPSGSAAGGPAAGGVPALRTAEQREERTAAAVCRSAPANRAALLGSIAAARATHAEALRGTA